MFSFIGEKMAVTLGQATLATINLIISQGADNEYIFRYSREVEGVLTPVDLTNYTARAQIRNKPGGTLYLDITDITMTSDGIIRIRIPHGATEAVEWFTRKSGVWDMELTDPQGGVTRFASGSVQISLNVTSDHD